MARMFKSTTAITRGVRISTIFEDDHEVNHDIKVGDIVENIRYIENDEIKIVSGKVKTITYTMTQPLTLDLNNPSDTLAADMKLNAIVLDASAQYDSKFVNVPLKEVVEWEDEAPVKRMKVAPFLIADMELKYSDYRISNASIEVGDTFNNVKIMNPKDIGNDITGEFVVLGFVYTAPNANTMNVNGVSMKNLKTGEVIVVEFPQIIDLNEVYSYEIPDADAIVEVLANVQPGDTVVISGEVDTIGKAITIDKEDVTVQLDKDIIAANNQTSGLRVPTGGKVTLTGEGKIVSKTPYDSTHRSGTVAVYGTGEVVFDGSGIDAVIEEDPVNKGQFGVVVEQSGKATINAGDFRTGWYCVSGNGSTTAADSVVEINGGTLRSVSDYAIYHPQPGKLVINGGDIAGAAGALAANNGDIEINGGKFAVLGGGDTGSFGDGTSGLTDVAINLNAKYGDVKCRITGGEFYATAAGTIMIKTGTAHTVDLKISGGKFTAKPNDEWLEEGYLSTNEPDADGFYVVYKGLTGE